MAKGKFGLTTEGAFRVFSYKKEDFVSLSKPRQVNDDGSPVLLMRNEGLSRKASYPLKLAFEGGEVMVGARERCRN